MHSQFVLLIIIYTYFYYNSDKIETNLKALDSLFKFVLIHLKFQKTPHCNILMEFTY